MVQCNDNNKFIKENLFLKCVGITDNYHNQNNKLLLFIICKVMNVIMHLCLLSNKYCTIGINTQVNS
jgi:hypothetical protein